MKKALVIFSGGQDSTTCLLWAKQQYHEVAAINFNYGQKHAVEMQQARIICDKHDIPLTVVDISFLDTLVNSALTSHGNVNETNELGLPASFVPNRNQLFITLSHAFAQKIGATVLVGGMCETDFSGYPDCRRDFIDRLIVDTNIGSGIVGTDREITMETPLMYLNKAETFEMAHRGGYLKDVIELSHTCYNGDRTTRHPWGYGCGECPACQLRAKGWDEFVKMTGYVSNS